MRAYHIIGVYHASPTCVCISVAALSCRTRARTKIGYTRMCIIMVAGVVHAARNAMCAHRVHRMMMMTRCLHARIWRGLHIHTWLVGCAHAWLCERNRVADVSAVF